MSVSSLKGKKKRHNANRRLNSDEELQVKQETSCNSETTEEGVLSTSERKKRQLNSSRKTLTKALKKSGDIGRSQTISKKR